jgi:ElaB/YqjD/DUF883 family membrane-anchored ribosome-binding protein
MENNPDPEVIRQRMADKRTALTEKLEAIEQQVLGVASTVTETVVSVKDGVAGTVEAVKETVKDTVENVKGTVEETVETVKETFNLRRQFERHPWAMLGGSVGVGMLFGALLRRRTFGNVGRAAGGLVRRFRGGRAAPQSAQPSGGNGAHRQAEDLTDSLLSPVKEGLTRIKDLALGTLFGTLQKVLVKELPEAVEGQVKAFIDEAVDKLKGAARPQEPQAAQTNRSQRSRKKAETQETAFHPETGRPMRPGSF